MSDYIVSARKYRPDSFGDLIGQDNIATTLKNSILRGKLAHAYLFCGPRGVGKTSTARIFAKTINCANPGPDLEPCGHCESCESFQEGRSYCIHELDAASNNSVDDIKTLMDQVQIPPQVGKYSVYIIDEVHMLSTQAFNAFLKTLEEPPAHAIFILATTEKHKILPTILSRCQTYDFNRIGVQDIVRNLRSIATRENITIGDESLHIIALKADGAMRDALTIFDQTVAFCGTDVRYGDVMRNLNVLDYDYSFSLVDNFLAGDYASAMLKFDEILSRGFNALHFVSALSSHFRDLMVCKSGGMDSLLELPDSLKKRYAEQAGRCPLAFLYNALAVTTQCESGYKASLNPRLHIEFTLMRLCFMNNPEAVRLQPANSPQRPSAPAPPADGKTTLPEKPSVPAPQAKTLPADKPAEVTENPEKPRARKRPVKTGAALSLNSIIEEQKAVSSPGLLNEGEGMELPSDELIAEKWKEMPDLYKSRPRMANTLLNSEIEITGEEGRKVLTFKVTNVAQQKWIEEKLLRDIEINFQKITGSSGVVLRVGVVPDTEKKTELYTSQEKARFLMSNDLQVKNLITDLGLDTK